MAVLRIHFGVDDLARVRIADEPDPMWEILLSLHVLRYREVAEPLARWRRRVAPVLPGVVRSLLALAPPIGYSPDFLTPSSRSLEEGVEAVLRTPKRFLRADLELLAAPPTWARPLADGEPGPLRALGAALAEYHRRVLEPHWTHIRSAVEADRLGRVRGLLSGGYEELLRDLHPTLRWEAPTLQVHYRFGERDLHLGGRGLRLVPSYFCVDRPIMLRDHERQPVLVYPVNRRTTDRRHSGKLSALLGQTRAAALEAIGGGCTTGELARRLGVSPASASVHATVLREAGLTTSRRHRNTVMHTVSPLGVDLLNPVSLSVTD
ncbi:helix-turn-helix protein [Umezawaea tangerina]|uniref:Helix-turn-helix protein n=1 Tax=Umezawaea tangerina TaxID=84725 RepID=A0A2T0TM85_9PSEU|nr:helix-turn-helix protein [Umezawaea tangerina]